MLKRTGKNRKCLTCNKDFYVLNYLVKQGYGKYCSLGCRRHDKKAKDKMSIAKIGKPSWNKGKTKETDRRLNYLRPTQFQSQGKSKLQDIIRHCYRYRQWRSDVYTRDDFICQMCGERGGRLNADHLKPFSAIINENKIVTLDQAFNCEELWNINNGRTLCLGCHKKTDTYLLGARYKH